MSDTAVGPVRILVGVHFRRHVGGPGHLTIAPGELVLTDRRGIRRVVHRGDTVHVERKRWEPPTGNHWIEVGDGGVTAYATAGRGRTARVVAALEACGFTVRRRP